MSWGAGWGEIWGGVAETLASLLDVQEGVVHLVEITVGTGEGIAVTSPGLPLMWGVTLYGTASLLGEAPAGTALLRFSDRGWIGEPDDEALPNEPYDARVISAGRIARSVPLFSWLDRQSTSSFGLIELANGDGALDNLDLTPADGRLVRVLRGRARLDDRRWQAYSAMTDVFSARAGPWTVGQERVSLALSSWGPVIDGTAQRNVFGGGGGIGGLSELAGLPRPLCFGQVFNVPAPLIDDQALVYQVHDGRMQSVDAVRDRGAALTFASDHDTYNALINAPLMTGQYATSLALGLVRIGSRASGQLTIDAKGDAEGGYVASTALIVQRFLSVRQSIDAVALTGFAQINAGVVGYWIGAEARSALQVVTDLLSGCGAVLGETRDGLLTPYLLKNPRAFAPELTIAEADVIALEGLSLPAPIAIAEASYRQNYAIQASDIAGVVTAADKEDYARPFRTARRTTGAGTLNAAARQTALLTSYFAAPEPAQEIADGLADLHGVERRLWSVAVPTSFLEVTLGAIAEVTHRRIGTAVRLQVVGIEIDLDRERVVLSLWG